MSPLFLVPTSPLLPLAPTYSAKVLGGSPHAGIKPTMPLPAPCEPLSSDPEDGPGRGARQDGRRLRLSGILGFSDCP